MERNTHQKGTLILSKGTNRNTHQKELTNRNTHIIKRNSLIGTLILSKGTH